MNIPLGKSFLNWMGAFVPEHADVSLIVEADSDDAVKAILHDLCKIGITRLRGVLGRDVIQEWKSRVAPLAGVEQLDATGLAEISDRDRVQIIDVRSPEEWSNGHLPGAKHIPLAALPDSLGELDKSIPIVLHCKGGGRSSIAASFLQSHGIANVANLAGGYEAWVKQGLPVEGGAPKRSAKTGKKK